MFYTLDDLKTPALILNKDKLENNIKQMARYARSNDIRLRPHCKTHKSVFVANRQADAGINGISVATLSEALALEKGNFSSVFITRQIAEENKYEILRDLNDRIEVICTVDSMDVAKRLSHFFTRQKKRIKIRLEIDSGQHRCGLLPEDATAFAGDLMQLQGVIFDGIFTHAGQVYGASIEDQEKIAAEEAGALIFVYNSLQKENIPCPVRSTGTTPTYRFTHHYPEINEIRPGVYVFYDRMQKELGTCSEGDIALTVMATIISRPTPDRCVINAGSKSLGLDKGVHGKELLSGYGLIKELPGEIVALSEEHGILSIPENSSLSPGDIIQIYPNHVCNVINLYEHYWLQNGNGYIEDELFKNQINLIN